MLKGLIVDGGSNVGAYRDDHAVPDCVCERQKHGILRKKDMPRGGLENRTKNGR